MPPVLNAVKGQPDHQRVAYLRMKAAILIRIQI